MRSVSFQDKVRCEQVCRDWRDLIRTELAPESITVILDHTTLALGIIRVRLVQWEAHHHNQRPRSADQIADGLEFTVSVRQNSPDLPSHVHSFVAWLFRRTAGLVDFVFYPGDCQLPCVQLLDLLATGLLLQPGATFHGTLGTPGFWLNHYGLCFYVDCSLNTSYVLVQQAKS